MKRLARRLAERFGWQVLERRFYSPVPVLDELPDDIFERESALSGIALDIGAQLDFAEHSLRPFLTEFGDGPPGFAPDNAFYETGDAEIAYAFVRHLRPRLIVELGSGISTKVLGHAADRNRAEGHPARLISFDPYPSSRLEGGVPGLGELHEVPVQDVPLSQFEDLAAGDVLFVDTSHTVKLGGDVNRVVLDVLPRLAPGVHVHFHDIWLPYEYHPVLVRDMEMYWNEQYLLQAFLSMNPAYRVIFATHAVAHREPERLTALIDRWDGVNFPSSFWIERLTKP